MSTVDLSEFSLLIFYIAANVSGFEVFGLEQLSESDLCSLEQVLFDRKL